MNREDIISFLRSADRASEYENRMPELSLEYLPFFERFASLVAAAERKSCAEVCDLVAREIDDTNGTATYCAKAIRARGKV